jgi:hypothetical protein
MESEFKMYLPQLKNGFSSLMMFINLRKLNFDSVNKIILDMKWGFGVLGSNT